MNMNWTDIHART